jgi:L-iditol 2-dehydrogenase
MTAPGRAEMQHFELALDPSRQAVVRVEVCGVCTPEQRVFRGSRATYPYWGGHELSGIVEAVPKGAAGAPQVGSRVALGLMPRCGRCAACRRGLDNHCAYINPTPRGPEPTGPRGFSDRIVVVPDMLFPVGPEVSMETASMVEPVACVLRSIALATLTAGETALIFGAGTMGLLHAALLSATGIRVLVVDKDKVRLDQAMAAGAIACATRTDSLLTSFVTHHTGGWGCDAVFCTRGGAAVVAEAVRLSGRGGRVVLYQSIEDDKSVAIDVNDMHYREIRLIGTIAQDSRDLYRAATMLSQKPDLLSALHVELHSASDGENALRHAVQGHLNRVLIDFRSMVLSERI